MTRSLEQSRVEVTRTTEQLERERGEARAAFARLEPGARRHKSAD